jgi:hypothetical protein
MAFVCAKENPEQALDLAQNWIRPGRELNDLATTIFQTLAAADPRGTAARALQLARGPFRVEAIAAVADSWGEADPHGALEWARSLPEGNEKQGAILSAVSKWASSNPQGGRI